VVKTLSMVYEAYKYWKYHKYTVYSNIKLNFPHIRLTKKVFDRLVKEKVGLQNAVLLIDEIHIWLDSRSGMSKKNKSITYFILQTRKRNVRLLSTTQHLHQIDKRLRDSVDVLCFCKNISNKTSLVDSKLETYILLEYFFQWVENATPMKRMIYANPVFPLYDTTEIVDMDEGEENGA
jgi:hypothetical protein